MTKKVAPMHPGEILREESMEPLGLTAYALAKALDVPRTRIERIEREETAITADTAHRLARYFRTTPQFWLNLQTEYDLRLAGAQLACRKTYAGQGTRGAPDSMKCAWSERAARATSASGTIHVMRNDE